MMWFELRGVGRRRQGLAVAGLALACVVSGAGQDARDGAEYFEFGTVVALGQRSVEVQAVDSATRRTVRHSFLLTRETRADLAHVGDSVEVIYSPLGSEMELRRLLVFYAGLPMAGPPMAERAVAAPAVSAPTAGASAWSSGPAEVSAVSAPAPIVRSAPAPAAARPASVKVSKAEAKARAKAAAAPVYLTSSGVAASPRNGSAVAPVSLGSSAAAKTTSAVPVPLGVAHEEKTARIVPVAGSLTGEAPAEECNRSDADWPSRPLRIAVLDFRYPTDREEAHDAGLPGGGSGTAVADLVFQRLEQQPEFAVERGDRRRLDRTDIAGAARLGRQLSVDAVLAGTFQPVEQALGPDGFPVGPQEYQLRAGVVDTCTGQLLLRLSSAACASGAACEGKNGTVTNKEAANPKQYAQALGGPIDTLLYPLEHNGGQTVRAASAGAAGVVTEIGGDVVVRLAAGTKVTAGEQLAVHASRLAKNPSTYTLNALQDQEIGRVSVRSVQGVVARGTFVGDVPPKVGDAAEVVTQ